MRRSLLRVLVPLVLGYVLLCSCVAGMQRRMTYFPEDRLVLSPDQLGLEAEEVELQTDDGLDLAAWWIPHPDPRGAVILCHGNGGNRSYALPLAVRFYRRGFSVLDFDYRGYGGNQGSPSEDGLRSDARAAYEHVTEDRGFAADRVLIHGHSLGSAVGIALAGESPAGGLIVENAFTSLVDLGSELYPWLPIRWLARDTWDNADRIVRLQLPIFVARARGDELIDGSHSERLAELSGSVLHEFAGDHNASCLFEESHGATGELPVDTFLDAHFPRVHPQTDTTRELPE